MDIIGCPFTACSEWLADAQGFNEAFRQRPGLKLFPRSKVVQRDPNCLVMNVSDGKRHIVMTATPQDEASTRITFAARGARSGYIVGWILVPVFGIGLIVLLRTFARKRGTLRFARGPVLDVIRSRFPDQLAVKKKAG